jgi:hypothetical protein
MRPNWARVALAISDYGNRKVPHQTSARATQLAVGNTTPRDVACPLEVDLKGCAHCLAAPVPEELAQCA